MAIIDKQGRFHGKAGGLVYRTIGDIDVVQTMPRKAKQTQATKESSLEFGLGSNTAAEIRDVLWPAYHSPDKGMVNRLTSVVVKCIRGSLTRGRGDRDLHDGDLTYLEGFQFNKNSPLGEVLSVRPEVRIAEDGKPEVRIPPFNSYSGIRCPVKENNGYTLRFTATAFHFRSEYYQYLDCRDVWIAKGLQIPEQVWKVEKILPAGSIVILTVSLFAVARKSFSEMMLNSGEWSPGEIIRVLQVPQGEEEILEPDYISGSGRGGDTDKPVMERTGSAFEMKPLPGYEGREIFRKIQTGREKLGRLQQKKEKAARERIEKVKEEDLKLKLPGNE